MSKRNMLWLLAVVAIGAVCWVAFGVVWGLIAAAATLAVSEIIERRERARRRAAQADASHGSVESSR